MSRGVARFFLFLSLVTAVSAQATEQQNPKGSPRELKEWTFINFLNGKNNLDSYLKTNINQMEAIGSTDQVNVVVQWGSTRNRTVKRLFVQKDSDQYNVTSPVIQDLGSVDMADPRTLVDFIQWAAQNYPAKHYFVNISDHGMSWHEGNDHRVMSGDFEISPLDISFDDQFGHAMKTEELGQAMRDAARLIGQKIDIYGSDACLMAAAEIANEMSDAVSYYVGSQEVEPAEGWPYDVFMQKWFAAPQMSPADVSKLLVTEYYRAYQGGIYGNKQVTFSAFDLTKMDALSRAATSLGASLREVTDSANKQKVVNAAVSSTKFVVGDSLDLGEFTSKMAAAGVPSISLSKVNEVQDALSQFVIGNSVTPRYANAKGVSIWMPLRSGGSYERHIARYRGLRFHKETAWGDAIDSLKR